jgi:hypothetical protein
VFRKLQLNPAVILYVVNALVAMVVAWGWHLTMDQQGAIDTIATGVLTIITAFMVRPIVIPTAAAAAITVLTAFAAFHLKLDPNVISTTVAVASIVLGYLLHVSGTPTLAAKQGKTAQQILLEAPNPGVQ